MKRFAILVILGCLALTESLPTQSKYRVYKNPRSKDALLGGTTPAAVPVPANANSDGDVAAVVSKPKPAVPEQVMPEVEVMMTTVKPKTGNTPVGEPTTAAPVVPPEPVKEAAVPVVAPIEPSVEPVPVVSPTPAVPSAEPVTIVPRPEQPKVNSTSEEDDSSSEEADEDEDDERRTLLSRRKSKSLTSGSNTLVKGGSPKNPPLKYDLVINGFVTEDGQVLVPFDVYQKYFHDEETKYLPPVYAITRDDTNGPSVSAVVSEETEVEKSSEESAVVKTEKSKDSETESAENPNVSGSSEETVSAAGSNPTDSDEKEIPSSEVAATAPVSNEVNAQPLISKPVFRPPLQALPARLPTNEDDEEEAGRRRHLAHFGYFPEAYDNDDYEFDDDEPHPYFGL